VRDHIKYTTNTNLNESGINTLLFFIVVLIIVVIAVNILNAELATCYGRRKLDNMIAINGAQHHLH
jgi:ABC-type lipoprotein release transport system permease subunit